MERLLPYLAFLLCPLMHLFLMRGMHSPKKCHQESRNTAETMNTTEE